MKIPPKYNNYIILFRCKLTLEKRYIWKQEQKLKLQNDRTAKNFIVEALE